MFTHIFVRSAYSFMNSSIRIRDYVSFAKTKGFSSLVLSDHNVMFGMAEFLKECQKQNIKGIAGLELDVCYHGQDTSFLLLAKDSMGYSQLMHLSSLKMKEKIVIDENVLKQYLNQVILVAYGEGGIADSAILKRNKDEINAYLYQLKEDFPDVYMGLSYNEADIWKEANYLLKELCKMMQIKTVAMHKVYYLKEEGWKGLKVLQAIQHGKSIDDPSIVAIKKRYLMDEEEMKKYYAEEDLLQTKEIIDSCYSHYVFEQSNLPKPSFVGQADSKQYLQKLCEIGLKKRLNQKMNLVYTKRLEKELAVIFQKHFEDYFLIVYDMIRFAKKEKDILVGSGRGSATGSLVSYCLGITNIDPIEHNLLFERFLNAQRTSMPDIDIDIQSNRADELFHYLKERYGEEYVCNSIAFTTFKVKSALQQASKCYRVNEDLFKRLTRAMVPSLTNQENPKLIDYLRMKEVKDVLMQYPILQKIYDAAMQIEDLPQAYVITSQSAVISDRKVEDVVPLLMDKDMIVSQYAKDYLEQFGLIKMDLLKVTTLDLLDAMRKEILKIEPSFQYEKIPDNDELVFAEFSRGETSGIFQLNKEANKRILRLVKPNQFSELANVLALIRPAVKGLVDQYVKNKANPTTITYPNADFESFMKDTYGVMIYQEQAMLASVYAGGFTLLEADNLRSAFKKKDKETIENMRMRFMDGAKARSLNEVEAGKLFEEIKAFASYGFNKAHAVAYALIAYRLVYIRIHYPLVYYKVRLDEEKQGIDAFIYIEEAKRRGIFIRLPHINEPRIHYEIEGDSLCIPLTRIKNISEKDALAIQEDYEMNGPYSSYFDFVARILLYPGFDETTIENLIYAGALDGFGFNRETMAHNIHAVLQYANLTHILVDGKKVINKNLVTEPMLTKIVMDKQNTTLKQKEVLGFVLDEDLLISMRKEKGITVPRLIEIKDVYHQMIKGFARVDDIYLFQSKYNETMASLTIADETYSLKLSLLPEQYRSLKDTLRNGVYILFDGKIEKENMIYARKIKVLD